MIKRITPHEKYEGCPCSYVAVGCAYEDINREVFNGQLADELRESGYLTLNGANKYIRQYLSVKKKLYFKRTERFKLREFLDKTEDKCIICVLGHYIYANGSTYWSFFDNEDDPVVSIWVLK